MTLKETIAVYFEMLLNLLRGAEDEFRIPESENPVPGPRNAERCRYKADIYILSTVTFRHNHFVTEDATTTLLRK
jgi:hypothetical protein